MYLFYLFTYNLLIHLPSMPCRELRLALSCSGQILTQLGGNGGVEEVEGGARVGDIGGGGRMGNEEVVENQLDVFDRRGCAHESTEYLGRKR